MNRTLPLAETPKRYSLVQIALHWLVVLLVIEQYWTSGAILRTHADRPLGQRPDPVDLTLHSVHTRVGLLIFVLVTARLLLRLIMGAPDWLTPIPVWRRRLSLAAQYSLYVVLLAQAATGAVATYLWWPASVAHKGLFFVLLVLLLAHLAGAAWSFATRPQETLFRVTGMRLARQKPTEQLSTGEVESR